MTRRSIVGVAVIVVACSNSKPAPPPPPPTPAPAPVKPGPKPVAIAMSFRAAIALLDDGTLRAWGNGQFGLLGKGKSADAATPIVVPGVTGADALEATSGMPLACAHLR